MSALSEMTWERWQSLTPAEREALRDNSALHPKLPVIFRAAKVHNPEITAVFPTQREGPGELLCYAHIGQHSACSLEWYYSTRPAKPHEYAALLAELRRIYESEPDAVRLVVYKRGAGAAA